MVKQASGKKLPALCCEDPRSVRDAVSVYIGATDGQKDSALEETEPEMAILTLAMRGTTLEPSSAREVWLGFDDFPPLKGGQHLEDELSLPGDSDVFPVDDNESFVDIAYESGSLATEDWDIVSNAATVISMDSKAHLSFRDAVSYSRTSCGARVPELKWIGRKAPLFATESKPKISYVQKEGEEDPFDAYSMHAGAKNGRGGLRKYWYGREPKTQR